MSNSVGLIIFFRNKYLVQKRDIKKNIYFPGIFGLFGGKCLKNETSKNAIKREIKEELNIYPLSVHQFLKIKFNTKVLSNRTRTYFFYKLEEKLKKKIFLKEGKSYHFYDIKKIKLIKFVPWDLAALLYYHFHILKKEQVKPEK